MNAPRAPLVLLSFFALTACPGTPLVDAGLDAGHADTGSLPIMDGGDGDGLDAGLPDADNTLDAGSPDVFIPPKDDAGLPDAAVDAGPEVPTEPPIVCPAPAGNTFALALAYPDGDGTGTLRVYRVAANYVLIEPEVSADVPRAPQALVINQTGTELIVSWGNSADDDTGLSVFTLNPDGSAVTLDYTVDLGSGSTPRDIVYLDEDNLIVTRIGAGPDDVVPLTRNPGTGDFEAGAPVLVPGEWPQRTVRLTDTRGALLRTNLLAPDEDAQLLLLELLGGALTIIGEPVSTPDVRPQFAYAHTPSGRVVLPHKNPDDDSPIDPTGALSVYETQGGAMPFTAASQNVVIPRRASLGNFSPSGNTLVMVDNLQSAGPGEPNWATFGVTFDQAGVPQMATQPWFYWGGTTARGLALLAEDAVAMTFDTGVQNPALDDALGIYALQPDGQFALMCGLEPLVGTALIAAAR